MNYGELKTTVADWIAHPQANASIPSFVRLAESVLRRDVRVPAMEQSVSGTMTLGAIVLPADYVDARRLVVDGQSYDYVTAEEFTTQETAGSWSRVFTRVANTLVVMRGASGAYSLLYSASFPAFTADSDTNWLLDSASDVYLFKTLVFAAVYLKDRAAAEGYEQLYKAALIELNNAEHMNRYSGGALVQRIGATA